MGFGQRLCIISTVIWITWKVIRMEQRNIFYKVEWFYSTLKYLFKPIVRAYHGGNYLDVHISCTALGHFLILMLHLSWEKRPNQPLMQCMWETLYMHMIFLLMLLALFGLVTHGNWQFISFTQEFLNLLITHEKKGNLLTFSIKKNEKYIS